MNKSQQYYKILILFTIIVLSLGCTAIPTGRYDALSDSSQEILNGTSDTYVRIEKLQRLFLIETAPSDKSLKSKPFAPVTTTGDKQVSFDLIPALHFREEAIQTLVKYTLVLQAFAKRDFAGEIDNAATEFYGSVKSLAKTADPNNEKAQQYAGAIATVVDVIGRAIVEKKRLDGLKKVMDSTQPHLQSLSDLIANDNEKIKTSADIMLDRILEHKQKQRPPIDTPDRSKFDSEVSFIISEVDAIKKTLDKIDEAIKKVPNAHAETRKKLDDKSQGFDAMAELIKEVQRIDKFYRSLK